MNLPPVVRRHWPLAVIAAVSLLFLLWGALAPLRAGDRASHTLSLEIRPGPGQPGAVRLTLGVQDVLLLRNAGAAPVVFGPVLLAPGREFALPFDRAGEHAIPSPALPGGMLRVQVVPLPDPGWQRLSWRLGKLGAALRNMPIKGPQ